MGDKQESMRADVIKKIRSFCISSKGSLTGRQLFHDYITMIGEKIPHQQLGFQKLEDFLRSEKSFKVTKRGDDFVISANATEKSAHIAEMVAKQKQKKPPKVRFQTPHIPPYHQTSKWRPKSNFSSNSNYYHRSTRPEAVSHKQFVNKIQKPTVASKVVIPENSTMFNPNFSKKYDLNQRLTNRVREDKAVIRNNSSENGNSQISNNCNVNSAPKYKPQHFEDQTSINSDLVNPLLATKRRISKKMSELSLERDSGNSSPTSEGLSPSPFKSMEFVRTDNPLVDLKLFAELHNLGEVVVSRAEMVMKRNKFFSCKVKIGSKYSYCSYPQEFNDPLKAEKYCCGEALNDLIPKNERKSLMISSERDILQRIPPMLEKHNFGIWAWQLKLDYSDKYNEVLPEDWIKIVDSSNCVQIEKRSNDYILYHCVPGKVLQKGQQRADEMSVIKVSVPANTVQFGEDGKLFGQVTCVMSVNEIWCQQMETEESNLYGNMMDRLQIYYQEHESQLIPETISHAGYYIAKYGEEYFRIRAVKVNEQDVECFFIDWGDALTIPKNELFELRREYAYAQAQAFVCRLVGLEELYDISSDSQTLSFLYEKQVVIELAADNAASQNTNDVLPVYMYYMDTGKSINEELIPKLTMELASPSLQMDTIMEVYISNIEENGDVYIQIRTQGYENFMKLKTQIEEQLKLNPLQDSFGKITKMNSKGILYFLKYNDGHWYRVKLIDWAPTGDLAQIYFVDHGNTDVITVSREILYPIDKINDVFSNYPSQALRLRMALDEIPSDFVKLTSKTMPLNQPVLSKIVGVAEDNIQLVELFKRHTDGGLFCINKSIAMESELRKKSEGDIKSKFKLDFLNKGNVPSTGYLKSPPLPNNGEYFEVCIPFVVNPYNFFIQPLRSKTDLDIMMERLQESYKNIQYGNLKLEDVLPGNIYASKHDDGYWYRTSVIKVIHHGSVSVFFCDFGYYQTISVKQLIPLEDQFMKLPHQAMKAKLADVKPIKNKWTMEACDEFKRMIEKKNFIALFMNIERDILYESDLILKIMLIDTSSEEDVYIGRELVKNGIAIEEIQQT